MDGKVNSGKEKIEPNALKMLRAEVRENLKWSEITALDLCH